MDLQIVWFLIVTVWTPNGLTKFDLEYETKQDCVIAMNNTQLIQKWKKTGPRIWSLECREWPLETLKDDRSTRV